jgi:hypothetical protein
MDGNNKAKPGYVDGYVLPVPKKNLPAYRRMAKEAGKVWRKYGALDYKECLADDLHPEWVVFPFSKAVCSSIQNPIPPRAGLKSKISISGYQTRRA